MKTKRSFVICALVGLAIAVAACAPAPTPAPTAAPPTAAPKPTETAKPTVAPTTATTEFPVPIPSGQLVPRTATSIPWGVAELRVTPINLDQYGYVQEEYFLTGTANVYNWPDTAKSAVVVTATIPYVTEILVTRPANMDKFSGNVFVEVGNATAGYDQANLFQGNWQYFFRQGDVHIETVSQPGTVKKLIEYNPTRYTSLKWGTDTPENGLYWDIYSQIAAWIRSSKAENSLKGKVKYVFGVGQSQSAVMLNTYINAVFPFTKNASGQYIYDGFCLLVGVNYFPIRSGVPAPYSFPSRAPVPIIRYQASADFANMMGPSDNKPISSRREDSDTPGDQYRLVEVAAMPHNSIFVNLYMVNAAEKAKVGATIPSMDITFGDTTNDFPNIYFYRGALANLVKWVRDGVKPPNVPRLTYAAMHGSERIEYEEDQYGNSLGGLRNPWADFPTATYVPHSYNDPKITGSGQFTRNYKIPFTNDKLKQMYGNRQSLVDKYIKGIDDLVAGRWFTPEDAALAKADLLKLWIPLTLP